MQDQFPDDASTAIPFTDKIDVEVRTDKGAYYGLVMSSPLSADKRSQERLLTKLDCYFADIKVAQQRWQETHATKMHVRLWVAVHPDSASEIFDLLERCAPWAEENHVEFSVKNALSQEQLH